MVKFERVQNLLVGASELPPQQRAAYLNVACGDDAALRAEVESLLNSHEEAGRFLASPTGGAPSLSGSQAATMAAPIREGPGTRIGPYKILQLIGEGGFGSVFMAEQEKPVSRRVALKIIKLGMDTKAVIARFEAERQALALMDHPNIAKVLDAGATETGRPYFVMELCKGQAIHDYCDKHNLSINERLELFSQVCAAVQHAHTKGIIHRDLKPNNVLVSTQDGRPHAKVIDFGIAKATASKLTEKTLFTEHRQLIGTPEYMSPEQAEGSLDIDTRTDVYSLGVLLYELLTGTTPFSAKELRSAAYAEIQRIIREVEPPKPSTRLSHNSDTLASVAAHRHSEPKRLGTIVRGDLDWIVMKALEKDRQRRYETANGLAMDIQRYLDGQAVLAAPPSAVYRCRKFVRRNRIQVIAGLVVAATLVLGVIGTTAGMLWAINQKHRAQDAETATGRELARANEIKRLLREMFNSVDPAVAQTADTTLLKKILADASERLSKGEVGDELVASELHHVIGGVYTSIGLYPPALSHLEAAVEVRRRLLGEEDDRVLGCVNNLGSVLWKMGRYPEAEKVWVRALDIERRVHGDENELTLATITNLGLLYLDMHRLDDALRMFETSLPISRRVLAPDHPFTAEAMGGMARAYQELHRYADAEKLLLEAIESRKRAAGEYDPSTYGFIDSLGILYGEQGQYAKAEPLLVKAVEGRRPLLGEEHPFTVRAMGNLAEMYKRQNRYGELEPLYLKILELHRRVNGAEHPKTREVMRLLADMYREQGRNAEAEPLYVKMLEINRRVLGEEHPDTLGAMHNLPIVYWGLGRVTEAETVGFQLLALERRVFGEEHEATLGTITNLGNLYNATGRYEDAVRMYEKSLPIKRRVLGVQHPFTITAMRGLAMALMHLGRREEAIPLIREVWGLQTAALEKPDASAQSLNDAAWTLLTHEVEEVRDPTRALQFARRACALEEKAGGAELWRCLDTLAMAQRQTGHAAEAVETQRRALKLTPAGEADRADMEKCLAEYEAAARAEAGGDR